jgi:hypothetical protein
LVGLNGSHLEHVVVRDMRASMGEGFMAQDQDLIGDRFRLD